MVVGFTFAYQCKVVSSIPTCRGDLEIKYIPVLLRDDDVLHTIKWDIVYINCGGEYEDI